MNSVRANFFIQVTFAFFTSLSICFAGNDVDSRMLALNTDRFKLYDDLLSLETKLESKFDENSWETYMRLRDLRAALAEETRQQQVEARRASSFSVTTIWTVPFGFSPALKERLKGAECRPTNANLREYISAASDPSRFFNVRFSMTEQNNMSDYSEADGFNGYITDCSHFVHDLYRSVGVVYPYLRSEDIPESGLFEEISVSEAQPGDLVLGYTSSSHVGILVSIDRQNFSNSLVVSATTGGLDKRSKLPTQHPSFLSAITQYSIKTLSLAGPRIFRLTCAK